MKKTALIMAGGRGERFWPKSRKNFPKQFLSFNNDNKTMIQLTVDRIRPLVSLEDIYIVIHKDYKELVQRQLPQIPAENILCEPMGRNTAPCIGWSAVNIAHKYQDALMIVLPSDHLITYNQMFISTLTKGCAIAQEADNLVTVGITPNYPETGYGYIKFNPNIEEQGAYAVDGFIEKPDIEEAKSFLETEEYFWNSGIFIWKASIILKCMEKFLPDLYAGLERIRKSIGTVDETAILKREYDNFAPVSIDYGIMEKADRIFILPSAFGWDDVGSWLAIGRIQRSNEDGNVVHGNIITIDSKNDIIQGGKKLIATVGIENMIIVDTDDAILICSKDRVGEIKRVVENLKICNREQYL